MIFLALHSLAAVRKMDEKLPIEFPVPETMVRVLLELSNSLTLEESLQTLIEISITESGRADLAAKNIVTVILQLCQALTLPSQSRILLLCLKLLRNLCAGELVNQNMFLEHGGIGTVTTVMTSVKLLSLDNQIIRFGLQLLGNVALAGDKHQRAVWRELFPNIFSEIVAIRSWEISDPLCMIICTCSEGVDGLIVELFSDQGLAIILDIIHTVSIVGFKEHWIKLLLSRICLECCYFAPTFSKLYQVSANANSDDINSKVGYFAPSQAFLLSILSNILNERINDVVVYKEFPLSVLDILRNAVKVVDSIPRVELGLPTGVTAIDVLGYSMIILRDICACDHSFKGEGSINVVDMLVSRGLIELLLGLLNDLEPPSTIRRGMQQDDGNVSQVSSKSSKKCPYKGFRRDIVAVLGNCAFRRRPVQDKIREKNGILLLLQQCVIDEDNPYMREWGIFSIRNVLEGNEENQRFVADLEMQGTVDVPEIAGHGLRVEADPITHRVRLVNK